MSMEVEIKSPERETRPNERVLRGLLWGVLALVIVGILGANLWSYVNQKSGVTAESPLVLVRTCDSWTTAGLFLD